MKLIRGIPLEGIPRVLFDLDKIDEILLYQLEDLWDQGYGASIVEQLESMGFRLDNRTNGPLTRFDYFNIRFNSTPKGDCNSIW